MSVMVEEMAFQSDPWRDNGKENPRGHLLQRKKSESEQRFRSLLASMKESVSMRDMKEDDDEAFQESDEALETGNDNSEPISNYVLDEDGDPGGNDPIHGSEFLFREYDNGKESMNAMMQQSSEQVEWSVFQQTEQWNGEGGPPPPLQQHQQQQQQYDFQAQPFQEYPAQDMGEWYMDQQHQPQPDEWSQGQRSDSNTFASASSAFDAPVKSGHSEGPVVPKPIRQQNYAHNMRNMNLNQIHEQHQISGNKESGSSDPWKDLFPLAGTTENQLGLAPKQPQPRRKMSKQSSNDSREPGSQRKKSSKKIKLEAMFDDDDSDYFSIGPSVHSRISQSGDRTVASQGSYHTATSRASASSRRSGHSQRSSHSASGSAYRHGHGFNRPPPPPMSHPPQYVPGVHGPGHPMVGLPYYPQYHHEPPTEAMRYYGNIPPEMMATVPPGATPPGYYDWARNNQYGGPSMVPSFPSNEGESEGGISAFMDDDDAPIPELPPIESPKERREEKARKEDREKAKKEDKAKKEERPRKEEKPRKEGAGKTRKEEKPRREDGERNKREEKPRREDSDAQQARGNAKVPRVLGMFFFLPCNCQKS